MNGPLVWWIFCHFLWPFLENMNFTIPELQIVNQDSEMIYYGYGMIAKLFVLSPNMKGQMKGVEKVFFEN